MTTRSKTGSLKPRVYAALCESPLSSFETEPHSVKAVLAHPKWKQAMLDEYKALLKNQTWSLVPAPVVCNKWVFKLKYNADGSLSKYKARLVAKGFHQTPRVDFSDTFSPVVKLPAGKA
ncbi:hypothetical protein ACOSQ3_028703 [Xanthoceras sorbifolium]